MSSTVETQVFGPYRVLAASSGQPALLGRGAFGTVFHAQHELTGQEVALKVIHDHLAANEQVRRRFRDEAREHRRLKHEGVVQILDSGETETTLYLAMEFCAGRDLQTWSAAHGPVTPFEALTLMRPIADALVYASGHGLIHRDIKPSNILLVSPPVPGILPTVKLADFGLAKKVWEDVGANGGVTLSASHSGGIKGTLQYASPEQVREEKLDNRSDMFALGLTLWHLLAGGYPFADQTTLQFIKERAELESYESRFPAEWPLCLRELMAKLLAGKAEDRYSTFGRVVGAIDYCLEELAEKAKPPPLPVQRPPALLPVREFFSLNWLEETPVGTLFDAAPAVGSSLDGASFKHQYLTLLRKDLAPVLREEIRQAVTRLAANPHPALAPVEWRETRDGSAVVIDLPPGSPLLLDVLRLEGPRRFSDSLPWLEQIAGALDHASRLGLPGVETAPAAISVVPGGTASNRRLLLTAKLYRTSHDAQASTSLTMLSLRPGEMDGGPQAPAAAFAFLAYRLLSSRDPKQAALSTPTAYVAIDALSETGNHYLREALCGHTAPSCLDLLALLCQAEAVTFHKPPPNTLTFPYLPPATPPPLASSPSYATPLPFAPPATHPAPFTSPLLPTTPTNLPSHSSAGLSMLKTVLDAAELEKKAALEMARQEREAALAQERLKAEQALALERQRAEAERRELAQRVDNERNRIIEEAKKQAEAERLQALEERRRAEEERMLAEAARLQAEARIQEERRQLAEQARLLEEKLAQHGQQLAAEREKNIMLEERNQLLAQEKNLLEQSQKQLLAAKLQIEDELSGLREREQHLTNQVEGLRQHENSLLSQVESLSAAERKAAHDAEEHAHRAAEAEAAARNAVASGTIDAEAAQAAATQAQRDREQSLREVARLQAEREKAEAQREEIARQAEAHQSLLAQTTADLHSKDEELRSKNAELQLKSAELEEKASQIALLLASKQEAEAQAAVQVAAREKAEAAQQAALELAKQAEAERQAAEQKLRELTAAREKAEAERRASEEQAAKERSLVEERARQLEAELRAKVEAERLATEQKVNELALMREKAEADRRALEELALKERELAEQRAREQETILRAKAEAERAAAEQKLRELAEARERAEAQRLVTEQKLRELAEAREKAEAERLAAEKLAAQQREETEKRLREKEAELRAKAEAERLAIEKKLQQEAKAREKAEQERRLAEKRAKEAAAGAPPRKTKLAWATIGVLALGAAGAAVYYATRSPEAVQVVVSSPPPHETRTFMVKGSAGLPQLDEETAQHFTIVKGPLPKGGDYEIGLQSVSSTTFPSDAVIGLVDQAGRFMVNPDQEGAETSAPPSVLLTIQRADSSWGQDDSPVTLRLRTNRDQKDFAVPANRSPSTWPLRLPEGPWELSWFGPAPGTNSMLEIPLLNTTLTAKALSPGDAPTTLTLTLPALPQSTFLITGENTFQYVDENTKSTHTAVTPTLFVGAFNYSGGAGGKARADVALAALTPNSLLALPSASFFRQWAADKSHRPNPEQDITQEIETQLSQLQQTYDTAGRAASAQAVVGFIDGSYEFWNHWSVQGNGHALFEREALRSDPRFYLAWSTNWMLTTGPLKNELSQHYKTHRLSPKLDASTGLTETFSRKLLQQLAENPANDFWALAGPNDGGLRGAHANGALEFPINPSGLDFTLVIAPTGNGAAASWKTSDYQLQAGPQEFTPFPIVRNMSVRLEPTSLHLLAAEGPPRPAATSSN